MAWTNEQQAAIDSRGQTLLLSAAAGSCLLYTSDAADDNTAV